MGARWCAAGWLAVVACMPCAHAASLLRIACDGADVGAAVHVNGTFRGDCPLDVQVSAGAIQLRVAKPIDAERERAYVETFRIGDGVVKKVEAVLAVRLTADGQRRRLEAEAARQRSHDETVQRYRAAADTGDAAAMLALGALYEADAGRSGNEERARDWYRRAADAGHPAALIAVARRLERGDGVPRDFAQALERYRRAAATGDAEAMYELGLIEALGLAGRMNAGEADAWYRRAADAGSTRAMVQVGMAHYQGRRRPRNATEAAVWFRRAADGGDPDGMAWLQLLLARGDGVPADALAAEAWRERAIAAARGQAERGDVEGMVQLAGLLLHARPEEGAVWRERAAAHYRRRVEAGDVRATVQLAGLHALVQDHVGAVRLYRAAADAGVVSAMTTLALYHGMGWGVPKSEREQEAWRRRAAERGDPEAADAVRAARR